MPDPWSSLAAAADDGRWEEAVALVTRLAGGVSIPPAWAAWRAAYILYLQDDLDCAEDVLARVPADTGDPADRAMIEAWRSGIRWARGDAAGCGKHAALALELAELSGHPQSLAAAHTVTAMHASARGDRRANDRHYALALRAAVQAGDRGQQLRIRANMASRRVEEGDTAGALQELATALAVDDTGVHPAIRTMIRQNHGEALLRTGRLAEARDAFRAALSTAQRAGTGIVAYPLIGLGECHELAGALVRSRASYEEAIEVAGPAGNAQALVPALTGLARVLAALGEPAAADVAARAVAGSTGLSEAGARAAAGWAALAEGDLAAAAAQADRTLELARGSRNAVGLAEGLELGALAARPDGIGIRPEEVDAWLGEAAAIWVDVGDPISAARVELARARLTGGPAVTLAAGRLRTLGADPDHGTRSLTTGLPSACDPRVRVLGSFAVVLGAVDVPAQAWQSRKARDLLKVLIARRGRPVTRDALGEALWPGEHNVGNRLSIALSVLRAVLDPDRCAAPDRYVVADASGIRYDPATLRVDVDQFLQATSAATRAARTGAHDEARLLYEAAVDAYPGEALPDDPDLAAAGPLRDEARSAFLQAARALGGLRAAAGDVDGAVQAWLRLVDADPYDEDGALRLIGLLVEHGRYGEAARHHRRYADRMRELRAPVAPMPYRRT